MLFWRLSGRRQGYLNLRGYKDLETENRANSLSTWVTFAISPASPEPTPSRCFANESPGARASQDIFERS
jgi:hypothetical protein